MLVPPGSPHWEAYTDGGCPNNRTVSASNPAGWGFCFRMQSDISLDWMRAFGPVLTNPDNPQYGGAEVGSNNTAELQAIIGLFDFIFRHPLVPPLPIKLHVDSQYALDILQGISRPTTHISLVTMLLKYWQWILTT